MERFVRVDLSCACFIRAATVLCCEAIVLGLHQAVAVAHADSMEKATRLLCFRVGNGSHSDGIRLVHGPRFLVKSRGTASFGDSPGVHLLLPRPKRAATICQSFGVLGQDAPATPLQQRVS